MVDVLGLDEALEATFITDVRQCHSSSCDFRRAQHRRSRKKRSEYRRPPSSPNGHGKSVCINDCRCRHEGADSNASAISNVRARTLLGSRGEPDMARPTIESALQRIEIARDRISRVYGIASSDLSVGRTCWSATFNRIVVAA